MTPQAWTGSAELSSCGCYRWRLTRTLGPGRRLLWVMLNPSTADGLEDDATIRRCKSFTEDAGFGALDVVNLFAWRATDPRVLSTVDDPIGSLCDTWIERLAIGADASVLAWGAGVDAVRGGVDRASVVRGLVAKHVEHVFCLGNTAAGHPRHPLYLRQNTPWRPL